MGITYARGSITGRTETREYDFLVDTGATWLSIPQADIDALLLDTIPGGRANILTANGIAQTPMYRAIGILEGKEFTAEVVPHPYLRLVGYKLLQELGFVVDLVTERIVLRSDWGNGVS